MLFPVVQVDDTLKESFASFQRDPLNTFKVQVRRVRVGQLRQLLSNPDSIDLNTFQYEVWNIENKTYLHGRNIDLLIFERNKLIPSVEQLLETGEITLPELEAALASNDLELHGNYIWRQGARVFAAHSEESKEQKLEQVRKALGILNNPALTPTEKALQIDAVAGFGENNATGLVMIFHPDEFVLVNTVSRGALKKLGVNLTASTSLDIIQRELRYLKDTLGAKDFFELDWFLYLCTQGKYLLGAMEVEIGDGTDKTWFDSIRQVLEDAGEPLLVSDITARVLASGLQTKGKMPDRTVSRILTTNPQMFEHVSEGVYHLKKKIRPLNPPQARSEQREYTEPSFNDIYQTILGQGLRIDERTLRRYHLALKTRGFVILSGLSGTGKTWLTEAYAHAIGAVYLLVPVAPNWTTNEDLLGYTDPIENRLYRHTAFSYFLEAAAQEYEQAQSEGRTPRPYHLALDEMNLARVEYYFAKFLSAMEVRARGGAAPIDLGAQKVVNLYRNLSFIGTINVDETTHDFADKIYDRAQLIELTASREALQELMGDAPYCDLLMAIWDAVHEVAPFAFRTLTEIDVYVTEAKTLGISWEEALDEQILQKILPKCRGVDLRIGDALKKLEAMLPVDTYPLSHAKIQRMKEGFQQHGLASYF